MFDWNTCQVRDKLKLLGIDQVLLEVIQERYDEDDSMFQAELLDVSQRVGGGVHSRVLTSSRSLMRTALL